jgi:hypothetical protein
MAKKKAAPKKKRAKSTVTKALKSRQEKPDGEVARPWDGPMDNGPKGGITQSLLGLFLSDRERFRLRTVEGLAPPDRFEHRPEYGSMFHVCEAEWASSGGWIAWMEELRKYCQALCRQYPLEQSQIVHWMRVCEAQFPVYLKYWSKDKDEKRRKSVLQEETFKVPYQIPSGRTVYLRGKWDGVSKYGREYFLDENKTKGEVDPEQIRRQLAFDLQTMFYLVALDSNPIGGKNVAGVRYNVILRPLSGGKGTIRKKKGTKKVPAETDDQFYNRLREDVIEAEPDHFFHRWLVLVSPQDKERFRREFLDPILEQLCDWWEWIASEPEDIWVESIHWRTPYGFYNALGQDRGTDLDEYLSSGSTVGLQRGRPLFTEL